MKGRSISEFITELYNNPEMEFIYQDQRYMISGYVNSSDDIYTLELCNICTGHLVFNCSDKFREKCVEQFEEAKIFDGKTVYQVEKEIEVLFG